MFTYCICFGKQKPLNPCPDQVVTLHILSRFMLQLVKYKHKQRKKNSNDFMLPKILHCSVNPQLKGTLHLMYCITRIVSHAYLLATPYQLLSASLCRPTPTNLTNLTVLSWATLTVIMLLSKLQSCRRSATQLCLPVSWSLLIYQSKFVCSVTIHKVTQLPTTHV